MSNNDNNNRDNSNKIGILIIGLGGNNGVTLLGGHIANTRPKGISWETGGTPGKGRVSISSTKPNWNGCITQLPYTHGNNHDGSSSSSTASTSTSIGVGLRDYIRVPKMNLAQAEHAVIGGWDIRSTFLGDALYESRVLDYDLVRQIRTDMNGMTPTILWPGIYNSSFVGESQHATATNIVDSTDKSLWDLVQHVRNDIQQFKQRHDLTNGDGHVTVIWSASVERPALGLEEENISSAGQLLDVLQNQKANATPDDDNGYVDISPSIIYATAAALEGCSFVNGGSQNTIIPAVAELYDRTKRQVLAANAAANKSGAAADVNKAADSSAVEQQTPSSFLKDINTTTMNYILGTDFKAGQTKFKTAAVEYIRQLGLSPRTIASSNHLGNNDMLNLTNKTTLNAKMRVKHSIFEPWRDCSNVDHQVRVMYMPYMGDEKRDIVEYTSLGFLFQEHTMLTYTRCMDSVLCVPLMIDVAVWCDYFSRYNTPLEDVAKATAYLFKIPEGAATGIDPGFHYQMNTLRHVLHKVSNNNNNNNSDGGKNDSSGGSGGGGGGNDDAEKEKKMSVQGLLHKGFTAGILSEEQVAQLRALVSSSS